MIHNGGRVEGEAAGMKAVILAGGFGTRLSEEPGVKPKIGFTDGDVPRPKPVGQYLLERLAGSSADVVLGLFPTDRPSEMDMVNTDAGERVRAIQIKPAATEFRYTWILAAWAPAFSEFQHRFLQRLERSHPVAPVPNEVYFGLVLQAAIEQGLHIAGVHFPRGRCLDIGTPGNLAQAVPQGAAFNLLPTDDS